MTDIILVAVILIQTLLHYAERRDMCNRLMSKDYKEYTQANNPPPKHTLSAHDRTLKRWRNKVGEE